MNILMDQAGIMHVVRYWFEVLFCTMVTHLGDLEVKVTYFNILC